MERRGPDIQGYKTYNFINQKVTLFHGELSILIIPDQISHLNMETW